MEKSKEVPTPNNTRLTLTRETKSSQGHPFVPDFKVFPVSDKIWL